MTNDASTGTLNASRSVRGLALAGLLACAVLLGAVEYFKRHQTAYVADVVTILTSFHKQNNRWPKEDELPSTWSVGHYNQSTDGTMTIRLAYGLLGEYSLFVDGDPSGRIKLGTY